MVIILLAKYFICKTDHNDKEIKMLCERFCDNVCTDKGCFLADGRGEVQPSGEDQDYQQHCHGRLWTRPWKVSAQQ
jgi:hypothetical protein